MAEAGPNETEYLWVPHCVIQHDVSGYEPAPQGDRSGVFPREAGRKPGHVARKVRARTRRGYDSLPSKQRRGVPGPLGWTPLS